MKNKDNLKKIRNAIFYYLVVAVFIFSILLISQTVSSYTLSAPSGPSSGEIGDEYEFYVYTMDIGSKWMFDWGDGTHSEWIELMSGETSITKSHSWASEGKYEIRVKSINSYSVASSWSEPLTLSISLSTDIDDDGWNNEIEESYGTNSEDPEDFPIDTDGDGIADEPSADLEYSGDEDDDGDGLNDEIEEKIGSDPKDNSDTKPLRINQHMHYLVDLDKNGNYDLFYNSDSEISTNVDVDEDGVCLIDYQGNGKWDYFYISDKGISEYKEEISIPWPLVILSIILVIILAIFILFKMGFLYVYEEYVEEEKQN